MAQQKRVLYTTTSDSGTKISYYVTFDDVSTDSAIILKNFSIWIGISSNSGGHSVGPWSSGKGSTLTIKSIGEASINKTYTFNANIPKNLKEGEHCLASKIDGGTGISQNLGTVTDTTSVQTVIGYKWTANSPWGNVNNPEGTITYTKTITAQAPKFTSYPKEIYTNGTAQISFTYPNAVSDVAVCFAVNNNGTWTSSSTYGGSDYQGISSDYKNKTVTYTFDNSMVQNLLRKFTSSITNIPIRFYIRYKLKDVQKYTYVESKAIYKFIGYTPSPDFITIQQQFSGSSYYFTNLPLTFRVDTSVITGFPSSETPSKVEVLQNNKVTNSFDYKTGSYSFTLSSANLGFKIVTDKGASTTTIDKSLSNVKTYYPPKMDGVVSEWKNQNWQNGEEIATLELQVTTDGSLGYLNTDKTYYVNRKIKVKCGAAERTIEVSGQNTSYGQHETTSTVTFNGLNPNTNYQISVEVVCVFHYNSTSVDFPKVFSSANAEQIIPVFEYGKDIFRVNGKFQYQNQILWNGAVKTNGIFMGKGSEISLSQNISDQASGIVLVFSAFDDSEDYGKDWDFQCHFIPKIMVERYPGRGHTIVLTSFSQEIITSKYLYIHNNKIQGHAKNGEEGSNRRKFVLRYVIGV